MTTYEIADFKYKAYLIAYEQNNGNGIDAIEIAKQAKVIFDWLISDEKSKIVMETLNPKSPIEIAFEKLPYLLDGKKIDCDEYSRKQIFQAASYSTTYSGYPYLPIEKAYDKIRCI